MTSPQQATRFQLEAHPSTFHIRNNSQLISGLPLMSNLSSSSDSIFTFYKIGNSSPHLKLTGVQLVAQVAVNSSISTTSDFFFLIDCLATASVPLGHNLSISNVLNS